MPVSISAMTARLEREVPDAEFRIDDALVAVSTLMTSVVTARRDIRGVPAVEGQATIQLLAKAQLALAGVSGDVLRAHGHLVRIGKETAGYDLHECPEFASPAGRQLHAVA
ncbi:hypothetical protein BV97_01189 [Novosphingobium resinovorum]|uniref:Uncharacterized protein n=1 Tax=Novosphingobium resinovorum TaxID=158500 RepID=A0A031K203_9SPHN|nr:hypothetical protein BV97_01189 [Novosphingobium resinovorum]